MYLPYAVPPGCLFLFWYFYRFRPLPPFSPIFHATVERSNILKDSIPPDAKSIFIFFNFVTAPVKRQERDNSRPELPPRFIYSASLFFLCRTCYNLNMICKRLKKYVLFETADPSIIWQPYPNGGRIQVYPVIAQQRPNCLPNPDVTCIASNDLGKSSG